MGDGSKTDQTIKLVHENVSQINTRMQILSRDMSDKFALLQTELNNKFAAVHVDFKDLRTEFNRETTRNEDAIKKVDNRAQSSRKNLRLELESKIEKGDKAAVDLAKTKAEAKFGKVIFANKTKTGVLVGGSSIIGAILPEIMKWILNHLG